MCINDGGNGEVRTPFEQMSWGTHHCQDLVIQQFKGEKKPKQLKQNKMKYKKKRKM
jgi:hypothetical protein